jgi:hypothetical protein
MDVAGRACTLTHSSANAFCNNFTHIASDSLDECGEKLVCIMKMMTKKSNLYHPIPTFPGWGRLGWGIENTSNRANYTLILSWKLPFLRKLRSTIRLCRTSHSVLQPKADVNFLFSSVFSFFLWYFLSSFYLRNKRKKESTWDTQKE